MAVFRCGRETIKYLTAVFMLFGHIGGMFFENLVLIVYICNALGSLAPVMVCLFCAEGFVYTHSRKKYIITMLIFAAVSQLPYMLATGENNLNMLFTLALSFASLWSLETLKIKHAVAVVCACVLVSVLCDWMILPPILTILFRYLYLSDRDKSISHQKKYALFIIPLLIAIGEFIVNAQNPEYALFVSLGGFLGSLLAIMIILFLYTGKKNSGSPHPGGGVSKWFFYVFYPAHFAVLYLIKYLIIL